MLFWITVIILLVGIGLWIYGDKHYWHTDGAVCFVGMAVTVISAIAVLTMLACILSSQCGADAQLEGHKARYEALTYKIESDAYRDEFGLLNKSVIDEVQKWNEDVVYYKAIQDDFWVGIFYPNVYDEFETIDYESYNTGE
jgi:hypothetical protein